MNSYFKLTRFIFIIFYLFTASAYADTLTVRGKVENLSVNLYRKAPQIVISRINVLRNEQEIVKATELQPNGSFELKIPLIYPQEECYVSYANFSIPFLGSNDIVEITIWGDSVFKSKLPIRFGGLYAATNQRHAQYYVALNEYVKNQKDLTPNFKNKNVLSEWTNLLTIKDENWKFFNRFQTQQPKDTLLDNWVEQTLTNRAKADFFQLLYLQQESIPVTLRDKLLPDTCSLLTFAKADLYGAFANYAFSKTMSGDVESISTKILAKLLLRYTPNLATSMPTRYKKLEKVAIGEDIVTAKELGWMSGLVRLKADTIIILSGCETNVNLVTSNYDVAYTDVLKSIFYAQNIHKMPQHSLNLWYDYIRPEIKNPVYAKSLEEVHNFENKDSVLLTQIRQLPVRQKPNKLDFLTLPDLPDVEIYLDKKLGLDSDSVFEWVTKPSIVPTYVLFFAADKYGFQALAAAQAMKQQVGNSLNFVFICDSRSNIDIWKDMVVKTKVQGQHLKLVNGWTNDLFVENWGIDRVPFAVLIDAKGKYMSRNAPLPNEQERWNKIWDKVSKK